MSRVATFHLPEPIASEVDVDDPGPAIDDLGWYAPRLGAARVAATWRALGRAAGRWRARPLAERIEVLARVAHALCERGPGLDAAALARSAGLSPAGLGAAWHATFAPWNEESLREAVRAENFEARLARPGDVRAVHVLAGNVFPATWSMLARGALVGAAQWLRPSRREPLFAALVARAVRDLAPDLAATFAVAWWPHGDDDTEPAVLAGADVVTAQGDDAAVAAIAGRVGLHAAPRTRFVGCGTRWSAALLSRAAQTARNAERLVSDIALFDQQGCLSPALVLAEDHSEIEAWCSDLASALATREEVCARGPRDPRAQAGLRQWRSAIGLGRALGSVRRSWESEGSTAWAVALTASGHVEESPLDRHVVVAPFAPGDDLLAMLGAQAARLQGLACDSSGWRDEARDEVLALLRPTRVAALGRLQLAPPSWRQDHRPPLGTLVP